MDFLYFQSMNDDIKQSLDYLTHNKYKSKISRRNLSF